MRVQSLYIYPIKSGPAVGLEQVNVVERGLAHDRRFMVVDAHGTFRSQRTHPALGRYTVRADDEALRLEADGIGSCEVALEPAGGEPQQVRVWGDSVHATSVSAEADAFFSALLEAPSRLVYMPPTSRRPVSGYDAMAVSFADGYPVLLANTASLSDLNARIDGEDLPMLAFRPNVVLDTDEAWAEDGWGTLALGEAVLECATGCERCSMTTLDPAWPRRPRGDGEPLRTLAKFRRDASGKVIFGRNAVVKTPGVIRCG
ncbi:MAG: MOSC domain-containing protein [Nannocystaceae bacterium]|nr:MOSC domain-containing protein [bacterium]